MFSTPRVRAQFGLVAALIVLVGSFSILVKGREGLRPHEGRGVVVQVPQAEAVALGYPTGR